MPLMLGWDKGPFILTKPKWVSPSTESRWFLLTRRYGGFAIELHNRCYAFEIGLPPWGLSDHPECGDKWFGTIHVTELTEEESVLSSIKLWACGFLALWRLGKKEETESADVPGVE